MINWHFFFSLLVFAQKRSNQVLAIFIASSFYIQLLLSSLIFQVPNDVVKQLIGTAHPVIRLPVFFMGICAGVLCVRIQEGNLDAFLSKILKN